MAAADLTAPGEEREPAVIVDDLHVTYKVWGARRGGPDRSLKARLKRGLRPDTGQGVLREVHAVRGVSFTAYKGEAVALVGRNGSGKSTLLRAIAGLLPATQGAVFLDGQASLLGVNAALMNQLTGERNIELGCLAMGMSPQETEAAKPGIVEFSGIGDFVNLPMAAYSSGMAARLRFAIAAAVTHDILMIDEALATGDTEFKVRSQERIEELRRDAAVVFLVSHAVGTVRETCNRAIWLDKGLIVQDGPANEVVDAYEAESSKPREKAS
jgi:teichoic acid transport system ATP-binding protein